MMPKPKGGLAGLLGASESEDDDELDGDEITSSGRTAAARACMDAIKSNDVEAFASALDDFIALGPA